MSHHPSCRPNDKTLQWVCGQCGEREDAEAEHEALESKLAVSEARERLLREALLNAMIDCCDHGGSKHRADYLDLAAPKSSEPKPEAKP